MFLLLSWDCLVEMHACREIQFTFLGGKLNSLRSGKALPGIGYKEHNFVLGFGA